MAPRWELVRAGALPGDDGQLLLVDREDGPDGRTVCVVPGHLVHRARDGELVRLLDEQDLENARLFTAAPALRETLAALLAWRRGREAAATHAGTRHGSSWTNSAAGPGQAVRHRAARRGSSDMGRCDRIPGALATTGGHLLVAEDESTLRLRRPARSCTAMTSKR